MSFQPLKYCSKCGVDMTQEWHESDCKDEVCSSCRLGMLRGQAVPEMEARLRELAKQANFIKANTENQTPIGTAIIEFIASSGLVYVDPKVVKEEYSGGLMIWSANAGEQLTEFIERRYVAPVIETLKNIKVR
jgi:hypothetical protein